MAGPGPRFPHLGPSIQVKLHCAVEERSYKAVTSLLAENFNCVDYGLLKKAMVCFDSSIFDLLLCRYIPYNSEKHQDLTNLLYFAAKRRNIHAIEPLLQYSANLDRDYTSMSATPLTGAASGGHFEIV